MRGAGWLVAALLAVGWIASQWPEPQPSQQPANLSTWRLTRDGWEQANWLADEIPVQRPPLHPGVVGLLQLLLTITGLMAFPAPNTRHADPRRDLPMALLAAKGPDSPTQE
jgi:hypothetical protein